MLPAAQVDTTSPLLHCVWGVPCSSWSEADLYPVVRYARGMHGLAVPSDMTQVDFYLQDQLSNFFMTNHEVGLAD